MSIELRGIKGLLPDMHKCATHDLRKKGEGCQCAEVSIVNQAISDMGARKLGFNRDALIKAIMLNSKGTTDEHDRKLADSIISNMADIIEVQE